MWYFDGVSGSIFVPNVLFNDLKSDSSLVYICVEGERVCVSGLNNEYAYIPSSIGFGCYGNSQSDDRAHV